MDVTTPVTSFSIVTISIIFPAEFFVSITVVDVPSSLFVTFSTMKIAFPSESIVTVTVSIDPSAL